MKTLRYFTPLIFLSLFLFNTNTYGQCNIKHANKAEKVLKSFEELCNRLKQANPKAFRNNSNLHYVRNVLPEFVNNLKRNPSSVSTAHFKTTMKDINKNIRASRSLFVRFLGFIGIDLLIQEVTAAIAMVS